MDRLWDPRNPNAAFVHEGGGVTSPATRTLSRECATGVCLHVVVDLGL